MCCLEVVFWATFVVFLTVFVFAVLVFVYAELSDERVVWAKTDVDKNATIAINNVKRLNMIFSFRKIKMVFYNVQSKTFPTYEGTRK